MSIFYFKYILNIKIHFVSKFRRKILIFEEIRAFSIYKGSVIFNPAVGGGRGVRGVKNIWRPALGALKFSTYLLRVG